MRDQNRGDVPRGSQNPLEDLRFAANVELRGGFVQQHHASAQSDGAQCPRERDPLPLAAREIRAAFVAASQDGVESRKIPPRPLPSRALRMAASGAPSGATLSRSGSSKRMKSWNTAVTRRAPAVQVELAQIDAIDLDRARLRVIEPA